MMTVGMTGLAKQREMTLELTKMSLLHTFMVMSQEKLVQDFGGKVLGSRRECAAQGL